MIEYNGSSGAVYRTADGAFAGGGEGGIYDIGGNPGLAAKIYDPQERTTERERKLTWMVSHAPAYGEQYAWPQDVLYENGYFAGYIMRNITGRKKLRAVYVYDNRRGKPWNLYIAIARNLAAAVANVHEIGQVLGDMNPDNILADEKDGTLVLVDTDSYHIFDGNRTYRCRRAAAEYTAPELQGIHFPSAPLPTFTQETDRFSLAVLIFSLLMNGNHPFACKITGASASQFQPVDNIEKGRCAFFPETCGEGMTIPVTAPSMSALPPYIQSLFHRAFVDGCGIPSMRPTALEWYKALQRLEGELTQCSAGHWYYKGASGCPWCEISRRMRSADFDDRPRVYPMKPRTMETSRPAPSQHSQPEFRPSQYEYQPPEPKQNPSPKQKGCLGAVLLIVLLLAAGGMVWSHFSGKDNAGKPGDAPSHQEEVLPEITVKDIEKQPPSVLEIPSVTANVLEIEPIRFETISAENADFLSFGGEFSEEDQSHTYLFEAPFDGNCRIDADGMKSGMNINIAVYDSSGNRISYESFCDTGEGVTAKDLKQGETYEIVVTQNTEYGSYTVTAGMPKEEIMIPDHAHILDHLEYTDQVNRYRFTAPANGRCRFELSGMQDKTHAQLYAADELGRDVGHEYCASGDGVTVENMKSGKTYEIQVRQKTELSQYDLLVSFQKEPADISGKSSLTDSLEYTDQWNIYFFTPERDGRCRFELSGMQDKTHAQLRILDELGKDIGHEYCTNGDGVTVDEMKTGKTYEIHVRQKDGFSGYSLLIGNPKEPVDVSTCTSLNDSVEYSQQQNIYTFTPEQDGRHWFQISGMQDNTHVQLRILDELGKDIGRQYCTNGDGVMVDEMTTGKTYEIQIQQKEGFSGYSLLIGKPKAPEPVGCRMAVTDWMEYKNQVNKYFFTADRDGDITLTLSCMDEENRVRMVILSESDGKQAGETGASAHNSTTLHHVKEGTRYRIQVYQSTGTGQYRMTIE